MEDVMKIGQLAQHTGCGVETIRYYEQIGLLPPPQRNSSNYRVYGAEHHERLLFIRHCRSLDMSLDEIRALLDLREEPRQGCLQVNTLLDRHIEEIEQRMAALSDLRARLDSLRRQCNGDHPVEECAIIQGLSHCAQCDGDPRAHSQQTVHVHP
ncbi:Cd(II)/Pb(II)-responsive transcriptional regulator [Pseudomonas sp. S 311-6]|jgi:Cd(II)/Pb(II)-responsive transcriptional regulator|nr:Cd(II)/Pb(II)-responsive transcriptional regulator [Kerstersia gyiorum]KAB0543003.1 Cd(II)/Pb(II)-responsive transcriptional regulator [Kerstersia gyiorum]MCH4273086.1 Cd(II)/Pb(II)-responsive transcriptional regulator [Kerstersia gyiorum]MCO7639621.1 Cd(II)/Pb(II)-responsive transcriptional regulator [Pseudomonas sp. S 311-6]QBR40808.1 Cd(II)/Pb(II)-responsive transcriptional regulator [Kerstersia gyiorum]